MSKGTRSRVFVASSSLAVALFALTALLASAEEPGLTVETAPPVVVRTVPAAGDTDVSAGLHEIRVTFSKTMLTDRMSCVQVSPDLLPSMPGKPAYEKDGRTLVLPVALEPGHAYAIWFNHDKYQHCEDAGGRPAVPYLLVFRTKPG